MVNLFPMVQSFVVDALGRHKSPANDETQVLLHLYEEIGELRKAIKTRQPKEAVAEEIADTMWCLRQLCEMYEIDLTQEALQKIAQNEKRSPKGEKKSAAEKLIAEEYSFGG